MTKGAAAMKKKEERAEDILRDLVTGKRTEVPAEGIPGVPIIYQSSPHRISWAITTGPVEVTAEKAVLVELECNSGLRLARIRYGGGERTWRFPTPVDPPPKTKPAKREGLRYVFPSMFPPTAEERDEIEKEGGEVVADGRAPRTLGRPGDVRQTHADHKFNVF
jgi:hypothetical protein